MSQANDRLFLFSHPLEVRESRVRGTSSLLTPTKEKAWHESAGLFYLKQTRAFYS